jgi:IS5 family transposase
VECIAKDKVHKKYEFGCKVSMVSSSRANWILAIDAIHGNPFDGYTLKDALHHVKQITGWQPPHAYCDRGYHMLSIHAFLGKINFSATTKH